jgi:putative heme iron utilization protein
MSDLTQKRPSPVRETTPEAIRLAKTLIRTARFGSLAVLDPVGGRPFASRVSVAADMDGTPLILISGLSFHTKALLADCRCSLLVGEPGKGDPLAHPRITLSCDARFVDRDDPDAAAVADRYLRFNLKSRLYAGFADFSFVRLQMISASLNGGFGQAYEMKGNELRSPESNTLREGEPKLIETLKNPENAALEQFIEKSGIKRSGRIIVTAIDSEGITIVTSGKVARVWFSNPVLSAENVLKEIAGVTGA